MAGTQQQPEAQAQAQAQQFPANTNFVRGQFHTGTRNLQQQLINGNIRQQQQQQQQLRQGQRTRPILSAPSHSDPFQDSNLNSFTSTYTGFGSNPANVEIIDEASLPDLRFKRASKSDKKVVEKRDLVTLTDGSIVDDKFFDTDWFDGLAQFGDQGLKQSLSKHNNLEDEIKEHDKEPAEGEVEAVRSYCNSCLIEPFQSALVLGWKSASAGPNVLKAKASTVCGDF